MVHPGHQCLEFWVAVQADGAHGIREGAHLHEASHKFIASGSVFANAPDLADAVGGGVLASSMRTSVLLRHVLYVCTVLCCVELLSSVVL